MPPVISTGGVYSKPPVEAVGRAVSGGVPCSRGGPTGRSAGALRTNGPGLGRAAAWTLSAPHATATVDVAASLRAASTRSIEAQLSRTAA